MLVVLVVFVLVSYISSLRARCELVAFLCDLCCVLPLVVGMLSIVCCVLLCCLLCAVRCVLLVVGH